MFDAKTRLEVMLARPRMWASTREGFLMQVAVLLEVLGYSPEVARKVFNPSRRGSALVGMGVPLTNTYAAKVGAVVGEILSSPPAAG